MMQDSTSSASDEEEEAAEEEKKGEMDYRELQSDMAEEYGLKLKSNVLREFRVDRTIKALLLPPSMLPLLLDSPCPVAEDGRPKPGGRGQGQGAQG